MRQGAAARRPPILQKSPSPGRDRRLPRVDAALKQSSRAVLHRRGRSFGIGGGQELSPGRHRLRLIERDDDVGGNWYYGKPASSVYRSTHLISSKRLTEFPTSRCRPTIPSTPATPGLGVFAIVRRGTSVLRRDRIQPLGRVDRAGRRRLAGAARRRRSAAIRRRGDRQRPSLGSAIPELPGQFSGLALALVAIQNARRARGPAGAGRRGGQFGLRHRGRSGTERRRHVSQHAPRLPLSAQIPARPAGRSLRRTLLRWRLPLAAAAADRRRERCGSRWAGPKTMGCRSPTTSCSRRIRSSIRRCCITSATARSTSSPTSPRSTATVHFVDGTREAIDVIDLCHRLSHQLPFIDPAASELAGRPARSVSERLSSAVRQSVCRRPDPARQRAVGAGRPAGAVDGPLRRPRARRRGKPSGFAV